MVNKAQILKFLKNKYVIAVIALVVLIIFIVIIVVVVLALRKSSYVPQTTPVEWVYETIDKHNDYRKRHGVPPLVFNSSLFELSQIWANELAKTQSFQHNHNRKHGIGENLARFWEYNSQITEARPVKASRAVDGWYNEIENYDFDTGKSTNGKAIGHFTQVVWRDTTSMGAAMVYQLEGKKSVVYIVANYYPGGNVVGYYIDNVPRPVA